MTKEKDKEVLIQPAAPRDKTKQKYVKKSRGIPVPAGYTLQDLSVEQRVHHQDNVLHAWKSEYNRKKGTVRATTTITRG